jgi:type I restriction enzyme S subunit
VLLAAYSARSNLGANLMKTATATKFKETEIGSIPEEWEAIELQNIVDFSNGKTSPERFDSGKFPVYGANGIIGFSDKANSPKGSMIVGRVGAYCGSVYFSNTESWVTDNAIKGNAKEKNDPYFLYYLLGTLRLNERAGGSGQPLINQSILNSIIIGKPPQDEQKQIAEILSSLDDKIELNRKINANLEKLASTLFKQWFVDFEFPDKNGKPYKSSGGKMIDSELGKIPDGWKTSILGEYINLDRGLSYKGKYLCNDGVPMLNLGTFDISGGMKFSGLKYYNGEHKNRNLVHPGDIVIANTDITQSREILGRAVMVADNFSVQDILFTHHIYAVRFLKKISRQFVYSLIITSGFKSNAITYATGTTVLFLPKDAVLGYKFILPNDIIQQKFENIIDDIKEKMEIGDKEIFILIKLRDSLLSRLMSGKIRI